jgi:hypothetical protein
MKKTFFTLMLMAMCFFALAQQTVYSPSGNKRSYSSEDIDIVYTPSTVKYQQKTGPEFAGLAALLPTAIDQLWKMTTNALEKRAKRFTAELNKQKSNLLIGGEFVPDFLFRRTVKLDGTDTQAFSVQFRAAPLDRFTGGFIYYVELIALNYSAAKFRGKDETLDYTFEIKITYYVGKEKKVHELAPLAIPSVQFGTSNFSGGSNDLNVKAKHRTDIVPLPEGGRISDISVKVIESNPAKVKAEKILALWNENKDNIRTVVNNFIPEAKGTGGGDDDAGNDGDKGGNKKSGSSATPPKQVP